MDGFDIHTKYKIGDRVWVMYNDKARVGPVSHIYITVKKVDNIIINGLVEVSVEISISYAISGWEGTAKGEDMVFASKEELLNSL